MVVGWCGTTKFDWFAIQHQSNGDGLTEQSKIVHITPSDFVDPTHEPLDVIILHVLRPAWENSGSLSIKITPNVAFAAVRHDQDWRKTQMLIFTNLTTPPRLADLCHNSANLTAWKRDHMKEILSGGFVLTTAMTIFNEEDLKKIAGKFRARLKRALQ